MIHRTLDGKFQTSEEAIEDVVKNQLTKSSAIGDRFPVCVSGIASSRTICYGVQFWTQAEIQAGQSVNTDGSISRLERIKQQFPQGVTLKEKDDGKSNYY